MWFANAAQGNNAGGEEISVEHLKLQLALAIE